MTLLNDAPDAEALLDLAAELDGRPVPGLRMTEKEFDAWCPRDVRAEWVDGEVIVMSPANTDHVDVTFWLVRLLGDFIEARDLGRLLGIETQARLTSVPSRRNPDLLFVSKARAGIIRKTFIDGAPDLVIEIVSPDSESRDWREKYIEYEKSGVREYWVIDPASQRVEAYALGRDKRYVRLKEGDERIKSKVLRGFYIRPVWLWRRPLPKIAPILKEFGVRM